MDQLRELINAWGTKLEVIKSRVELLKMNQILLEAYALMNPNCPSNVGPSTQRIYINMWAQLTQCHQCQTLSQIQLWLISMMYPAIILGMLHHCTIHFTMIKQKECWRIRCPTILDRQHVTTRLSYDRPWCHIFRVRWWWIVLTQPNFNECKW